MQNQTTNLRVQRMGMEATPAQSPGSYGGGLSWVPLQHGPEPWLGLPHKA